MRVTDAGGVAVDGATVTWSVVSGGGVFAPAITTSDANGIVLTAYTLGEVAGVVRVRANIGTAVTQDFDIKALPGPLAELTPLYTDLSLRVGSTFTGTVRAVDGYGNGIPGMLLTSRPGDIQYTNLITTPTSPATQTTDATGSATFTGIVGDVPGLQSFLIDGPEISSIPSGFVAWFRVRATGDRGYITPSQGQAIAMTLSRGATVDVDVVVVRSDGTPGALAPVTFSVGAGNGSIVDANGNAITTSSTLADLYSGHAQAKWHLPATPGTYNISATTQSPNDGRSPLVITAIVQ
jgi:hypothetical protein